VFDVVRGYAEELRGSSDPIVARLPELLAVNSRLEAAQPVTAAVFAHNDLLPANLIDDGRRLWLIDFEYSAPGEAVFDLGGLSSNAQFEPHHSEQLLAAYFGAEPTPAIRAAHAGMACASLLREALWALVSDLHLAAPGADYRGYARENMRRFDDALAAHRHGFATAAE
jgi:thiamine kinase-like enzyme